MFIGMFVCMHHIKKGKVEERLISGGPLELWRVTVGLCSTSWRISCTIPSGGSLIQLGKGRGVTTIPLTCKQPTQEAPPICYQLAISYMYNRGSHCWDTGLTLLSWKCLLLYQHWFQLNSVHSSFVRQTNRDVLKEHIVHTCTCVHTYCTDIHTCTYIHVHTLHTVHAGTYIVHIVHTIQYSTDIQYIHTHSVYIHMCTRCFAFSSHLQSA